MKIKIKSPLKLHLMLRSLVSGQLVALGLLGSVLSVLPLLTTSSVQAACSAGTGSVNSGVLSAIFPPWYKYLESEDTGSPPKCTPKFESESGSWAKPAGLVALAILELLIRVAGLVAVGFGLWGGLQYIISQGEPAGLKAAKDTLTNSIVGLLIVTLSSVIINFLGAAVS